MPRERAAFAGLVLIYIALIGLCLGTLVAAGDLSFGRSPWQNLVKSVGEFARPSVLDVWFGPERLEFRSDDGALLRVENRRAVETAFVAAVGRATWVTFQIATLGSLLAAVLALPLGLLTARNLNAPRPLAWAANGVLGTARAVHTLVFGLVLVGVVGLGPTAGILAIALHSMGTYGKLYAESIEALDMAAIDAVRATGATPLQVFFNAVWPAVLPQFVVPTAPLPPQYLAIGATMTVVDVIVMSGYAGLAARLLRWLRTPRQQTALGRTFSGLFATAAVVLSLVRRMTPA